MAAAALTTIHHSSSTDCVQLHQVARNIKLMHLQAMVCLLTGWPPPDSSDCIL